MGMRGTIAGAMAGGLIGGALIGYVAMQSDADRPAGCPTGWTATAAPPVPAARPLIACERAGTVSGATAPMLAVYRVDGDAASEADPMAATVARARGLSRTTREAPSRDGRGADALNVVTRSSTREVPLLAEIYFVAAGHRIALVSLVHTPDAPFANATTTAAWIDTLTGTSPWGSDDAGPVTARCPDGFASRPTDGVLDCVHGTDTAAMTVLTMRVGAGGFATDADRAQAGAFVARMAQTQGSHARVTAAPAPFTLAHNADALHASVDTGERATVQTQVSVAYADGARRDTLAVAVSEGDDDVLAPLRPLATPAGFAHRRAPVGPVTAALLACVLTALGAIAGALATRSRS